MTKHKNDNAAQNEVKDEQENKAAERQIESNQAKADEPQEVKDNAKETRENLKAAAEGDEGQHTSNIAQEQPIPEGQQVLVVPPEGQRSEQQYRVRKDGTSAVERGFTGDPAKQDGEIKSKTDEQVKAENDK